MLGYLSDLLPVRDLIPGLLQRLLSGLLLVFLLGLVPGLPSALPVLVVRRDPYC